MEQQTGESELLLTCAAAPSGVVILRCAADTPHVVLPDRVLDTPVTSLGPYALSDRAPHLSPDRQTFQVRVTCGGPEPRHNAAVIRSATIDSARELGIGDSRGSLEAGKMADIVVLDADPLADLHAFTDHLVQVYKEGSAVL